MPGIHGVDDALNYFHEKGYSTLTLNNLNQALSALNKEVRLRKPDGKDDAYTVICGECRNRDNVLIGYNCTLHDFKHDENTSVTILNQNSKPIPTPPVTSSTAEYKPPEVDKEKLKKLLSQDTKDRNISRNEIQESKYLASRSMQVKDIPNAYVINKVLRVPAYDKGFSLGSSTIAPQVIAIHRIFDADPSNKKFLYNSNSASAMYEFQAPQPNPTVYMVCEGVTDACLLHRAFKDSEFHNVSVLCAFNAGNIYNVVAKLVKLYGVPEEKIVIFADNDVKENEKDNTGVKAACKVLMAFHGVRIIIPDPNRDATDIYLEDGADALEAMYPSDAKNIEVLSFDDEYKRYFIEEKKKEEAKTAAERRKDAFEEFQKDTAMKEAEKLRDKGIVVIQTNSKERYFNTHIKIAMNYDNLTETIPLRSDARTLARLGRDDDGNKITPLVAGLLYNPTTEESVFTHPDGNRYANTFMPHRIKAKEPETKEEQEKYNNVKDIIKAHVSRMMDATDADNFLRFCKSVLIGRKLQWYILVRSNQGIGKNMFGKLMSALLEGNATHPNCSVITADNMETKFLGFLRNLQLGIISEVDEGNQKSNRDIYKKLKMITDDTLQTAQKMKDPEQHANYCNLIVFTNNDYAFVTEKGDRRTFTIQATLTRKLLPEEYRPFNNILQDGELLRYARYFFDTEVQEADNERPINDATLLATEEATHDKLSEFILNTIDTFPFLKELEINEINTLVAMLQDAVPDDDRNLRNKITPLRIKHALKVASNEPTVSFTYNFGNTQKLTFYILRNYKKWEDGNNRGTKMRDYFQTIFRPDAQLKYRDNNKHMDALYHKLSKKPYKPTEPQSTSVVNSEFENAFY